MSLKISNVKNDQSDIASPGSLVSYPCLGKSCATKKRNLKLCTGMRRAGLIL
jgi:hypothetical protein